jgi:hypothetical protein
MEKATIIGIDLAKHVFQVHGACADGSVAFRKKISRLKLLPFLSSQPRCVVAMEACAGAHYWARDIQAQGHEVRLIAPVYVKPFVKRQKNDTADAEAITEAAARPTMRFVAVKSAEKQASGMVFKMVRHRSNISRRIYNVSVEPFLTILFPFGWILCCCNLDTPPEILGLTTVYVRGAAGVSKPARFARQRHRKSPHTRRGTRPNKTWKGRRTVRQLGLIRSPAAP